MRRFAVRAAFRAALVCGALLCAGSALAGSALAASAAAAPAPDSLWIGEVITLDENRPRAGAVAVRAGRIVAVGEAEALVGTAGPDTRVERFDGALLPGFIDAHGHLWLAGMQAAFADLKPPPDGGVGDLPSLLAVLREWTLSERADIAGDWIVGMGYDDAQLAEQRHPTREDLDAISGDRPMLVVHQSWHLGVLNSAGLARLGIGVDTPDPEGGHLRRDAQGVPTGVLEERAFTTALGPVLGAMAPAEAVGHVRRGIDLYRANGFTTAQDGASSGSMVAALRAAAARAPLPIDVTAYVSIADLLADPEGLAPSRRYRNGLRIAGTKLLLDGSPQGKTAWLTRPYHRVPPGRDADYRGYAINPDEVVNGWVDRAFAEGWPVIAHANGDAAADQLIGALRFAQARHGPADRRTTVIHAQTLRDDQLDALVELDAHPSFFSAHTYYWGDWHRDSVLGPERADRISPTRSALERGLRFTVHHDAPVIAPNPLRVIHATVNRRTRSGDILGPGQRVDIDTALRATTIWAARQLFEEDEKGSIVVGKRADFTLLSADPLATDAAALIDLAVRGTIKDGEWVWRGPQAVDRRSAAGPAEGRTARGR